MTIVTSEQDSVRTGSATRGTEPIEHPVRWQQELKSAIRSGRELVDLLELPASFGRVAQEVERQFPVLAPHPFVRRMQKGNPADPLLRQVLPLDAELSGDGLSDPLGEQAAALRPGLLQKYQGRALMITSGACAIHCRYCFRRHFPYSETPRSPRAWEDALRLLRDDDSITEILLSGGDPLTLADAALGELLKMLDAIPHLQRIRVHTRLPVVIPARVTARLLKCLGETRQTVIMVMHINHAAEIDDSVATMLDRIASQGIPLLNQTVLLRGVNDTVDALQELCERLVNLGVMPYYLHQLDPVRGATHFEVPVSHGVELIRELRVRLPGYAVPRYVQEIPGELHKTVLA